ncbi:hypothetical protein MMPV_001641 [Pyropia vietnamensis]
MAAMETLIATGMAAITAARKAKDTAITCAPALATLHAPTAPLDIRVATHAYQEAVSTSVAAYVLASPPDGNGSRVAAVAKAMAKAIASE